MNADEQREQVENLVETLFFERIAKHLRTKLQELYSEQLQKQDLLYKMLQYKGEEELQSLLGLKPELRLLKPQKSL